MAIALGIFAFVALLATFGSTLFAIWTGMPSAGQFMELTEILLSWKVISGGLVVGGVHTFKKDIAARLSGARQRQG
jgi:hypothetical protein